MPSKSRSLPLTELANLYHLPDDQQYERLWKFVQPVGARLPSYSLVKRCVPEICGAAGPLLPPVPALREGALWDFVTARAKGDLANRDFNWPVVSAMSDWVERNGITARYRQFDDVPLVGTHRKRLVSDAVVLWDRQPTMLMLDPRRSGYLTMSGIFVVQSMIHNLLRDQYPDLEGLEIAILLFFEAGSPLDVPAGRSSLSDTGALTSRKLVAHRLGGREPIPYGELKTGILKTLTIFDRVLNEYRASLRRKRGGE